MRTLSADWMANTSKPESDLQPLQHGGDESRGSFFHPRPVAPTSAQVILFYLISQLNLVDLTILVEDRLVKDKCVD